jgi:hypothetical protein
MIFNYMIEKVIDNYTSQYSFIKPLNRKKLLDTQPPGQDVIRVISGNME